MAHNGLIILFALTGVHAICCLCLNFCLEINEIRVNSNVLEFTFNFTKQFDLVKHLMWNVTSWISDLF